MARDRVAEPGCEGVSSDVGALLSPIFSNLRCQGGIWANPLKSREFSPYNEPLVSRASPVP